MGRDYLVFPDPNDSDLDKAAALMHDAYADLGKIGFPTGSVRN